MIQDGTTFQEYLQDGTILCKSVNCSYDLHVTEILTSRLIERIQPGLIKRVNYAKSPFAWRVSIRVLL